MLLMKQVLNLFMIIFQQKENKNITTSSNINFQQKEIFEKEYKR